MSAYEQFLLDDVDETLNIKKKNSDAWVMSFADVVTVLLCFFIIFYMIEKQYKKRVGFGHKDGSVQEYQTKLISPEITKLISTFEQLGNIETHKTDEFLEIHFKPESFFEKGRVEISNNGQSQLATIVSAFKELNGEFSVQIQGHTDNTPVRWVKDRWWKSNMELSILRSLSVYKYLIAKGTKSSIYSVAGYGENKKLNEENNKKDQLKRRITFRIEPQLIYQNGGKNE